MSDFVPGCPSQELHLAIVPAVLVRRISVAFMFALTRETPAVYGTLQEAFLEEHPGALHGDKIVITDNRVTQKLDLPSQIGDLARDQPGSVHHGSHPRLGGQ